MDAIDKIEQLLREKGISGAQMSRDLGFSNAVYSQWKNRKQKPSVEKIEKMAEYFEVTTDYLLGTSPLRYNPITNSLSVKIEPADLFDPVDEKKFKKQADKRLEYFAEIMELLDLINDRGKEKVIDYAADLARNPDYKNTAKLPTKKVKKRGFF